MKKVFTIVYKIHIFDKTETRVYRVQALDVPDALGKYMYDGFQLGQVQEIQQKATERGEVKC